MPNKPPMPSLAACLSAADAPEVSPGHWPADGGPLVSLPRDVLDTLVAVQGPGFASLALLMRDEGYSLAVFVAGGPALTEVPEPFVAILSDRNEAIRSPYMFDYDTVERLAEGAAAVIFTECEGDDAAMLAGLGAVHERGGSLVVVDAPPERIGLWLDTLRGMSPTLPVLLAGAFARPAVVN